MKASRLVVAVGLVVSALAIPARSSAETGEVAFDMEGRTLHGPWRSRISVSLAHWTPGKNVLVDFKLSLADSILPGLAAKGIKVDSLCVLATAERTFDGEGWMRLASDERMSTLLTPTGLAIEGGIQGAASTRFGYPFRSPFDQLECIDAGQTAPDGPGFRLASFAIRGDLPWDLPPGLYRLRFDLGVIARTRLYNLNGYTFATRPGQDEADTLAYFYSPVIPASAKHASGRQVDGRELQARFPWLLLSNYNSNGYRGVVADEDQRRFATSDRSLIPDDVILPMYDVSGYRLSYSLEPQFPTDTIDARQNIPWNYASGQLSVRILGPDGQVTDLGAAPFAAKSGNGVTTKVSAFTAWKPQLYGRHVVTATGWINDIYGRRYEGGGTYRFWIAKRMTLATATFQGMPYKVGSSYGRDIQFNPPLPAFVQVWAKLYVGSQPGNARSLTYSGTATAGGLFGAAQGMKSFPLNAPGEYHAQVLATYTDPGGHLWVSTMRHSGVVYADSSPVTAQGKKLLIGNQYLDRGSTRFEGYIDPDGTQHLAHITFPYQAGDVLLIAAEGQGANKIEPVLTYRMNGDLSGWDSRLNGVGTTNLQIKTSNGYSPHLYPEYITDREYFYAAAPRPGFMGRFLVGESTVRAPYWPTSPNSFGGQIGASPNGDTPGDIYRLIGGVALRRKGQSSMYAGYLASAFILPKGSNDNRVVAAGSEDLNGPLGEKARFFLVGLRPGSTYEVGASFRAVAQIDPLLPVSVRFDLTYPDGRRQTAAGTADKAGSFAAPSSWPLDVPGVYKYRISATWNGFEGRMPGLPEEGGEFYVYQKTRPAGSVGLQLDGPVEKSFSAATGFTVTGTSSASSVHYSMITPGAVIEIGEVPVRSGRFELKFDPEAVHAKVPLYDVVSITTGKPQIGRAIHLTFFSQERTADGRTFYDFARVILRGTTAVAARAPIPTERAATATANTTTRTVAAAATGSASTVAATDPESIRAWDAVLDGLAARGELRTVSTVDDTVIAGRRHERLQQFRGDVPILGAQVTRQTDRGFTVSIFGTLYPAGTADTNPVLGADEARRIAEETGRGRLSPDTPPTLVLLPIEGKGLVLAWRTEVRTGTDVMVAFLGAANGQSLLEYSNLKRQRAAADGTASDDVRVIDLGGDANRTARALRDALSPGTVQAGSASSDPTIVDALRHSRALSAYLRQRFGRDGFDGRGGAVSTLVHPVKRDSWGTLGPQYESFFTTGFWDGRFVLLGEGLPAGATARGRAWTRGSASLDVVAHELAHVVLDTSADLLYHGESGALAEAFADILAIGTAAFTRPGVDGPAAYRLGKEIVGATGIRALDDPALNGDPDHWSRRRLSADDNASVHANSTIAGHAFYLAVEGGRNRTSGLAVEGVGRASRDRMEKAFYRAFVYLLPSSGDFSTLRRATAQSARDLYGTDSDLERAVTQAWDAVGVH